MFCSQCGTQVAEGSAFCHKCGSKLSQAGADQSPPSGAPTVESPPVDAPTAAVAPPPPEAPPAGAPSPAMPAPSAQPTIATSTVVAPSAAAAPPYVYAPAGRRPVSSGQVVAGVVVLIGVALAIIGCLMPWAKLGLMNLNAFDFGYITDVSEGSSGNDGIIVLLLGLAAGGLAIHYFLGRVPLASFGIFLLGAAVAGVAGYNLAMTIIDIRDMCDGCNPMEYVGEGMYLTIAGGVIAAIAALVGMIVEIAQPARV